MGWPVLGSIRAFRWEIKPKGGDLPKEEKEISLFHWRTELSWDREVKVGLGAGEGQLGGRRSRVSLLRL